MLLLACSFGCNWPGSETPASATQVIEPPESEIPFETKEPDVFQADLVTIAGGTESHTHYARKGASWRIDTFEKAAPRNSIISTEKQIHVDHRAKTYAEAPSGGGPSERPAYISDLTQTLVNQKQRAKFEKLSEGQIVRYRVAIEGTTTPWIITYDASIRMVTRQEPETLSPGGFIFEMRGFTLDVSDDAFRIPAGYRKVVWAELAKVR
jgi:hypothetical protein